MSERLGPPPVENLSDVAWARVERNVFSRMGEGTVTNAAASREVKGERTRTTWAWLAVPATAVAAAALVFFTMTPSAPSTPADEPSRIVATGSPTTATFGDVHITLQANSAVMIDKQATRPTALVENGTLELAVAPRGDRPPFTVLAGDTTVRTVNATFTVTRTGERADVEVKTGSVDIRFRGRDIKLAAGNSWTSEHP